MILERKNYMKLFFFYLPNKKSILFFIFNCMDFEDAFFNTKDYELSDQTLGKGALGTVYIVKNIKDRQQYAAKIINTDL